MAARAWALPCSLVGALITALAWPLGARVALRDGVFEVALTREGTRRFDWLRASPFAAITFGHVVIGRSRAELDALRSHELAHVRQYERWGPLFFVAYPVASLIAWLAGRHPYEHNRFEVLARAQAAQALRGAAGCAPISPDSPRCAPPRRDRRGR